MKTGRYICGIDYGTRKIGVAFADTETCIASAHDIVPNTPDGIARIIQWCKERDVHTVVVGVPNNAQHGNDAQEARTLGATIADALPSGMVCYHNEMFTTVLAQRNRRQANRRGGNDDAEAARIILQEWCDHQ